MYKQLYEEAAQESVMYMLYSFILGTVVASHVAEAAMYYKNSSMHKNASAPYSFVNATQSHTHTSMIANLSSSATSHTFKNDATKTASYGGVALAIGAAAFLL